VPANVLQLNFADTGPLASVLVTPGERVRVGQVLATEDSSALSLAVTQAHIAVASDEARLAYLESEFNALPAAARATSPLSEALVQERAVIAEARVEVSIALARLSQTRITSPIDGTVLRTAGVPGELVGQDGVHTSSLQTPYLPQASVFKLFPSAGGASTNLSNASQPVISLVAGRRWQVVGEVPESVIASVRPGQQGTFQFDDLGGLSVPVVVNQVVDVPFEVDGQVSYEVVLRLSDRLPAGVLPGMSGTLSFK
jgi:multidrug resistance efflux pump